MGEVASSSSRHSPIDNFSNLPLRLIKSETIPPAPTRSVPGSQANADFLLDFAGYSWIAYGAASLLVISHFPNPLMDAEAKIGPIYRQVIELSQKDGVYVSAVSWSPATPSVGELAVALGDHIVLVTCNEDETSNSSFCWSQTGILEQSMKVETIQWTGSGDGIISVGIEVVMWRRKEILWEIAWSFKPEFPQALVSTTWSTDGFSATAPSSKVHYGGLSSSLNDARQCVLVFQGDGHSIYPQAELHHPMPVRMIQWRPSTGKPSHRHARHALRPVLLTCCLDGAVRLWSELEDGRIRKSGKDNSYQKATKLSFCVVAVIEVNQTLNGFLGSDVFVSWATEVEGVAVTDEEVCSFSSLYDLQHDTAGRCEWLIGFGPNRETTMWTIHCLDDFAPLRFPRVTLWKKQELVNFEMGASEQLVLKVLMMRRVSGPPVVCSLVQLLPCNTFVWTQLYSQPSSSMEGKSANGSHTESPLTSCVKGVLEVEGHSGKILQLAVHPFSFDVELAASLDGNGMLVFWSFPTFFNSHVGLPISTPSWKLCGRTFFSDHSPNYMCLSWAPAVLGEGRVLLMGHADGIDCFIVTLKNEEGKFGFHKLFSIPFRIEGHEGGLSRLCSIALTSNCNGDFISSKFLLVALWMDGFQALSWEISIHCHDFQGTCQKEHLQIYESSFSGKNYSVSVDPCSSLFPVPHNDDKVTSCSVVCSSDLVLSVEQKLSSADAMGGCCYAYHMVTGCVDGSLKLWRSMPAQSLSSDAYWSLVGVLSTNQGPIMAVAPSACGQKIATASTTNQPTYSSAILIWECMHVQSSSCFMLENELHFEGEIVALNWLRLGNGHSLLGVCLQNELRVYVSRRRGGQDILKLEKPFEGNAWICIAVTNSLPAISDFLWGPKGTLMVVHNEYFGIFSHFLLLADNGCSKYQPQPSAKISTKDDLKSIANAGRCQCPKISTEICFCSMSEIAENIGGSLPMFHPEALMINLSSGNWKRALIALRHLVKHLASSNLSKQRHGAKISSNIVSPVPLSTYLEGLLSPISSDKLFQWSSSQLESGFSHFAPVGGHDAPNSAPTSSSTRDEFNDFVEAFERLYDYEHITKVEKMQALALIDLLQDVGNPHCTSAYGSLDEPGRRFWVAVRFQRLHFAKRFSRSPLVEELVASSGLIGWAYHSDCRDNLFNSLLSAEPSWEEMRSMGVGFWYTNAAQLRVKMERLARQRYMKNKDPKACTLLYITLNRLQVLAGLFKISKDEKDKPLAGFLSRNFQEDKNKAAALKNAYVLMGKHQLELAIAFFLLGGDASSAVTVCAKNLGDEQLALVICRLLEGCGGPLERDLISKFLLPSALSKGDFWMASFLEWMLGNYSQSFMRMLGFEMSSEVNISALSSSHASFLDPSIGQYCLMLATKTSMKNAIGEFNAAVLCRWASLMNAASLRRCGLPLEALECIPSSDSLSGVPTNGSVMHSPTCNLPVEMAKQSVNKSSSNWISDEMSCHIVLDNSQEFEKLLKEFQGKLTAAISYFQQKFSLVPHHLISMIVLSLHQNGLEFIGKHILRDYIQEFQSEERSNVPDNLFLSPANLLWKATEEISCLYVKYVVVSCGKFSRSKHLTRHSLTGEGRFCWLAAWSFSNQGIVWALRCLRTMLQLFLRSYPKESLTLLSTIIVLFEYHVFFASAWLHKNFKALLISVRPMLLTLMRGSGGAYEIKMEDLNKLIAEIVKMLAYDSLSVDLVQHVEINGHKQEQSGTVPDDEIWHVSASLWVHMSKFLEHQLSILSEVLDKSCSSSSVPVLELKDNNIQLELGLVSSTLVEFLKLTCTEITFYCSKQFATYLLQEANVLKATNLFDLEGGLSQQGAEDNYQMIENIKLLDNGNNLLDFEQLSHICNGLKIFRGAFLQEYRNWLLHSKQKSSSGWGDAYASITREFESEETWDKEDKLDSPSHASGSPLACLSPDDHPFKTSGDKDSSDPKRFMPFQNPKEIYKRNGELLEALCINSIDQGQAALASNKKGIIFFNWDDGVLSRDKSEYIWGEADWPHNGWASSDSFPVPTDASPVVGLGSKKGAHIGFGGATIGAGDLTRSGRDSSSGAFGVPGYSGAGSSSLGWGIQESPDEFLDPPATVNNVKTMAFASHPSRPFFLVGSGNTHIYLWEFGKDTATATYGVLPAANVPPPYALASVSAVRFDHCGHRFVTAALDGTVSTWQLEVGGRSNIRPTESSVCFNNHSADVTYVTASGSIVAAAGYSSSGVNVVIWDTLAPPATSRASIMCHEGGARSLSVFDNDIGSGSISPLILTGGKGGDVGLHDFRYIATGRTKKHKHMDSGEHNINASSSVDMRSKTGDQNRNGMLWYIPKAHSGSVTKISTIPNTSFFLTGSKDGDVKLWDAKRAKLAAVTDIQVVSHGFLTCGGDGSVKFVGFQEEAPWLTKD
ncbi:dmx-like protein 1 [Phtheirospermum japonicum]|uniref:Dmx-like protein 1 n=1 Tax=Phtheirospermum japonicum TaxID=374723 RepID=A0A830BXZ8_9LAMI|nr:dmx-like protein 1 [Phtheirospermum japonicum]